MTVMKLISADSHVVEPPDLWGAYIDPAFRDRAPRLVRLEDTDVFECDGQPLVRNIATVAAAGQSSARIQAKGRFEQNVRQGAWDPHARLADMEADGVEQEVLYPSVGLRLFALKDADLQLACFRAYNNWLRDFCAAYPEKLKGSGLISLLDVGRGVAEVERARHIGMVGVTIAINPDEEQLYADARYDPFWETATRLSVPVTLHVLTERKPKVVGKTEADLATEDIAIRRTLTAMVFGGVFERFPDLNIVSAENDIGWLPYFLERLDYLFDRRQNLSRFKLSRALPPSAYIHKSVFFTFMRDSSWVPARSLLNMDNIMWGSDFPHLDSVWPHSRDVVARVLAGVSEEERRNVVAGNVSRLYGFARATTTAHK